MKIATIVRWFCAVALSFNATAHAAETIEFELPRVDGARFFKLSEARGRAAVINVWDTDCPPCVREMPLLEAAAAQHPAVMFIGVSVSTKSATRDFLARHPVGFTQLLGPAQPAALLRKLGNRSGALPHTVVLTPGHEICERHTGELTERWLGAALARCARPPATN